MKRRSQLRPNPGQVRAFQQRAQERARERARAGAQGRSKRRQRRSVQIPQVVRRRVYARSGGVCVRPDCDAPCAHVHHWLDRQMFPELELVEDNMSGTCPACNWSHHSSPDHRLPRSAIPSVTWRLAEQIGPRATAHLERYYPTLGGTEQIQKEA